MGDGVERFDARDERSSNDWRERSEVDLTAILQGVPAHLLATDREGRIEVVSDVWLRHMGYRRDDVVGRRVTDLIEAPDLALADFLSALRQGRALIDAPHDFVNAEGRRCAFLVSAQVPRGAPQRCLLVLVDVSSQREAEAMASRERRIRMRVLESAPDAIFIANPSRTITDANPAAVRLFGYGIDDIKGSSTGRFYAREEDFETAGLSRPNHRDEEDDDRARWLYRRKDGSTFVGETVKAMIWDDDGTDLGKIGIVRDVTEQERRQHELEETNRQLTLSLEVLDQFAYVASHDLRTPLRGILHIANFLEEDSNPEVLAAIGPRLGQLRERVDHMDHMLTSLLDYARLGHDRTDHEPVDLGLLLDRIETTLRMGGPSPDFTLERDLAPATFLASETAVEHILSNLVANAVTHHDGEHAHIVVRTTQAGTKLRLSVQDDGPGIPARHHERIFEIFRTLTSGPTRTKRQGLAGMGLALVRRLAIRAGGRVEVISPVTEGRGCRFDVLLPLEENTKP